MAKLESQFWQEVKKNIKQISFTRLESWASAGVPDLLCYNKKGHFFTIEMKVSKTKKLSISPHQIAFHVQHPNNSFILTKTLGPLSSILYENKISKKKIFSCITHIHVPWFKNLRTCKIRFEPRTVFLGF
tara:strand:+ start:546 stop:935 length:390 start_codon:yes stop_codon:yes gene_type:complete